MNLLVVENLTAGYYSGINVIQDVNVEVKRGELVSIIGPNGAGKSTLLRAMYGLLKPSKGKVLFKGKNITKLSPYEKLAEGIAFIQQERSLFPYLTVKEHLELGGWLIRKDKRLLASKVESILEKYPLLKEKKDEKATNLSGGMQRLLEIARSQMLEPEVILLDEPTSGLAPKLAKEIYKEIEKLKREKTILLVDQNVKAAVDIADYVYVLELGKVAGEGKKEEIVRVLNRIASSWIAVEKP